MSERDLVRFVEAVALGEMADQRFKAECRRVGICPSVAVDAPLSYLALAISPPKLRRVQ